MLLIQTFRIIQGFKNIDIIGGLKRRSSGHVDGVKRKFKNTKSTDLWIASEVGSDKAIKIGVIVTLGLLTVILFLYINFFHYQLASDKKDIISY